MQSSTRDKILERMTQQQPQVAALYNTFTSNESLSANALALEQERQLAAQLRYMKLTSPYFRSRLTSWHESERALEVLPTLPTMNKQTLLEHFDDIVTTRAVKFSEVRDYLEDRSRVEEPFRIPEYLVVSTAGTTGKAGYFVYSSEEQTHMRAQYLRFMRSVLTNVSVSEPLRTSAIIMTGTHMIGYKLMRNLPKSTVQIIPVADQGRPIGAAEMARRLEEFRPHILTCFGSTLRMITEYKELNPEFKWSPKAIVSTGATLDRAVQRHAQRVFPGVQVFDLYGSTDTGYIAWTCEHGAMHINADSMIVEVLDEQGRPVPPGESGRIHITTFWHRTVPILRYALGDVVALCSEVCPCGRSLPLMASVLGRENTLLYRRAGGSTEPVSQGFIVELFEAIDTVHRFRLVQHSLSEIQVDVVSKSGTRTSPNYLVSRLQDVFGTTCSIDVREVAAIAPNARSGKLLPVERTFNPTALND